VIVLIVSLIVCCIGVPASLLIWLKSNFSAGPSYSLTADGDRLFVRENLSGRELVLQEGKVSGIKIEANYGEGIVIQDHVSENRQKGSLIYDYFWSPKNQAVFFSNQVYDKDDVTTELWQWTPAKSFERLHVYNQDVGSLHESLDGKCITGTYYEFGDTPKSGIVVYNLQEHSSKTIESTDQMHEAVLVAPDKVFVAGNPGQIWTLLTNKTELMEAPGQIDQLVVFRGELWALRYESEKYQIVKLSKDFMSYDKVIDFPADFPKVTEADQMGD
jgi:hypothetical protein